jgi:hypothetical protein
MPITATLGGLGNAYNFGTGGTEEHFPAFRSRVLGQIVSASGVAFNVHQSGGWTSRKLLYLVTVLGPGMP